MDVCAPTGRPGAASGSGLVLTGARPVYVDPVYDDQNRHRGPADGDGDAPREQLTTEAVDDLEQLTAAGVMVEGAADETLAQFRVAG